MLLCFFLRAEESKKLPSYEEGVGVDGGLAALLHEEIRINIKIKI